MQLGAIGAAAGAAPQLQAGWAGRGGGQVNAQHPTAADAVKRAVKVERQAGRLAAQGRTEAGRQCHSREARAAEGRCAGLPSEVAHAGGAEGAATAGETAATNRWSCGRGRCLESCTSGNAGTGSCPGHDMTGCEAARFAATRLASTPSAGWVPSSSSTASERRGQPRNLRAQQGRAGCGAPAAVACGTAQAAGQTYWKAQMHGPAISLSMPVHTHLKPVISSPAAVGATERSFATACGHAAVMHFSVVRVAGGLTSVCTTYEHGERTWDASARLSGSTGRAAVKPQASSRASAVLLNIICCSLDQSWKGD